MKRTLLAIGLALMLGTSVQAKTPKEVLEPYKAFQAAIKANDMKAAHKYGHAAWQAAEKHLGDSKTTSDLAQNYATLKPQGKSLKEQVKAMKRSMEMTSLYGEDADSIYMERGVGLLELHTRAGDTHKIRKDAKKLLEYAKKNNQDRTVFYGEALTIMAGLDSSNRNGDALIKTTSEALDVFENPDENYPSAYPIFANLYQGFGHEYNGDILQAALSYQKVMDTVGHLEYSTHPVVGRALGRWSHMRTRLHSEGKLDEAKEKGLCDCWPYDVERNESVKPIKRVPPNFPSEALGQSVSGYTIVQFDLNDEGEVINPEIIVSWPPEVYEKSSLRSLAKWEYSARRPDETDKDRKNIVTTIQYRIEDRSGEPVY